MNICSPPAESPASVPGVEPEAKLPWQLAWILAVGQLVSWGILYYAFTVVVGPMLAATGWSGTFAHAGLSLGLLTWGLCALPAGIWIQRRGGRELMATASAVGGAALVVMGAVPHPIVYLLAWLCVGAALAGLLYEPAFAVVTAAFGAQYRRGITLITLVGGLASTIVIPLAQVAVDAFGWRGALVMLGSLQATVGVSLHVMGVPRHRVEARLRSPTRRLHTRMAAWWKAFRVDATDARFVGLALWFTAQAAAFTGLIFQLVPVLQALGVSTATVLQAMAVIGPMQVFGRFVLTAGGYAFSSLRIGKWAMAGLFSAVLVLLMASSSRAMLLVFAAAYGVSNGVMTILRGTVVAEVFGRERYAELNGALSAPAVMAKAMAPLGLAGLWSATGEPRLVFAGVLVLVGVGFIGLGWAVRAHRSAGTPRRTC
jgi:MFS family permease